MNSQSVGIGWLILLRTTTTTKIARITKKTKLSKINTEWSKKMHLFFEIIFIGWSYRHVSFLLVHYHSASTAP